MPNLVILPALLVSFICGSVLLLRGVWRFLYGTRRNSKVELICFTLTVFATSLLVIDAIQESRELFSRNVELFANLASLLLFALIVFFSYQAIPHHGAAGEHRKNLHAWSLLFFAITISGWSYYRIQVRSRVVEFFGDAEPIPGEVARDDRSYGITDKGNLIPLYRLETDVSAFVSYAETLDGKYSSFEHDGIERNGADLNANCHGWVFTDGRFLLKGNDVDVILTDNDYVQVAIPEPGDVVIYRDSSNNILHTGLVQGILRDGTVISESKWGVDKRYLHLPSDQPYSAIFQYYRTARSHHLIEIQDCTEQSQLVGG